MKRFRRSIIILAPMILILILWNLSFRQQSLDIVPYRSSFGLFIPLDSDNVTNLKEIMAYSVPIEDNPITWIRYNPETEIMQAFVGETGSVYVLIPERGLIEEQKLGYQIIDIDEKGGNLIGGSQENHEEEDCSGNSECFNEFLVINLERRDKPVCLFGTCENYPIHEGVKRGAAIDSKGQIAVVYDYYGYSYLFLDGKGSGSTFLYNGDERTIYEIRCLAIDGYGQRLVYALSNGRFYFESVAAKYPWSGFGTFKDFNRNSDNKEVSLLKFSSDGRYLLAVYEDHIKIWPTWGWGNWLRTSVYDFQKNEFIGSEISANNEVVFLAASDEIRIYKRGEKEEMFSIPAPGITALELSEEGHLLIWADRYGTLHVLGISGE